MNLEQIALRVAEQQGMRLYDGRSADLVEFARHLVAELTKGQEPVAALQVGANPRFVDCIYRGVALPADQLLWPEETRIPRGTSIRLYAAPPIFPTVPDGWQLVPKIATPEMNEAGAAVDPERASVWDAMLAAAPEAKP